MYRNIHGMYDGVPLTIRCGIRVCGHRGPVIPILYKMRPNHMRAAILIDAELFIIVIMLVSVVMVAVAVVEVVVERTFWCKSEAWAALIGPPSRCRGGDGVAHVKINGGGRPGPEEHSEAEDHHLRE